MPEITRELVREMPIPPTTPYPQRQLRRELAIVRGRYAELQNAYDAVLAHCEQLGLPAAAAEAR